MQEQEIGNINCGRYLFTNHGKNHLLHKKMKLLKNFVVTLKSKGTISTFLAVKNFFFIKFFNTFSSSEYIKKKIFTYKMYLDPKDKGISRTLLLFGERELDHKIIIEKVLKKKNEDI